MRHPIAALMIALVSLAAPLSAQDIDPSGEATLLERLNELRAQAGAGGLQRDAALDSAARVHSEEMAATDRLMHVSQTTGTPVDRVRAAGVDTGEVAENVAMHSGPAQAQQALEASDAHLANMLNPRFTHVGLSVVRDESGVYVTEVFARRETAAETPPLEAASPATAPPAPELAAPAVAAPAVAAPAVAAPAMAAPAMAAPAAVAAPAVAAAPAAAGATGAAGQVVTIRTPQGATSGFWVCGSGRWWYYPLPTGTTSGQLQADTSVTGSPPGYGGCAGAAPGAAVAAGAPAGVPAVASGAPTYSAPRVVQPGMIVPWGGVRVVGPQPYPARPYPPALRCGRRYGRVPTLR